MKPETKYKGSIKLSAIGDALGWITEFEKSPQSIQSKFGTDKIDKFYDWSKTVGGRFYGFTDKIKAGSYSDDTQLLLSVARSIKMDGSVDNEYFSKVELPNWLDYARGGGRTVKTAADKISRKSIKWYNNFYTFKINNETVDYRNSGANGAAMRVLPIALANLGNEEKIKEEIFCNSIITHGHPRALLGAMLYGYAVNTIIVYRPEDFTPENFITQIGSDLPAKFNLSFNNKVEIKEWLKEWNRTNTKSFEVLYGETTIEAQNQLRFVFQSIKQDLPVFDTLQRLGCFEPATKGSGLATVIAGIYLAAKFHNSPLQAVITSVNALGSDTDSIAAFAGSLIGALHGQNIIPEKWKGVQDLNYLDKTAERLLAISEEKLEELPTATSTNLRKLNNPKKDEFNTEEPVEFVPLGRGKIVSVDRQPTLTKGKYNLIVEVQFEIGQSIIVSKLFDEQGYNHSIPEDKGDLEAFYSEVSKLLKPSSLNALKSFIKKQKKPSSELLSILLAIIKNEE
jgi:ADP-ribosylglycohydrolase